MAIEDKKDRDTVLLTGLPVSDEMQDILERCADGKYVDVEEVKATPEMKAAESCVSYATPTIQLKDREAIENHVFETLMDYGSISLDEKGKPLVDSDGNTLYNGDVEKGRRLDIVIGLPASGKSSAIVDTISYEQHSMLIDNDEAKRQFPEFNKGWGANTVHKESQIVERAVFKEALREGRNIVLPKVGSDADKLMKDYIAYAKDAGYKVNVHFVDLDRNKALGRMMGRFIHTGRYLSPELIDKYANERDGNKIAQAYEALKSMDGIDGCSKWDNDVGRGEKPILVEAANLDDDFIKNARMKGDMENEERKHGQFTRGSEDDLCFSGDSAGDRGADAQSGSGDKRADGRDGEHDTGRAVSIPEEDLRQVSGVSHPELFDENIPEVYEGEMPELFARQVLAMTTGHDTDGNIIADASEHKFRPEYAVETYNDNPDDYAEVAKGVTFTTVYGDVQLDSVSQYDVGRFNLTEEQFTGTLLEGKDGLEKGQKIVFEKEDIMAIHVDYRDIDVRADTSLMNDAYVDRKTEMENPEHDRTYRCYVDGDKSAFDVCLFKDDDGKKHFYIEDTADYPLITGELPKETEFTPGTAVSLMNDMGECYDGSREFIVYDVHMPERTEELMDKSRKEELFPTALFVSEIREHGTSIHRYDCCDDFNAKAFGESIKDRNEEHGIRTMTSVAMKKQPEKVHEVSKSQQDVVETFRAKTRDLFHELDGQNAESIESMVRGHVEDALQTFDIDAQVVDVVLVGSRCRGIEHEDSDVDVVVEYYGSEREDSLFNILNEEGLSIGGRNIDINPITKDRSGTLETYLPEVEKYLAEKAQSMEQPSRDMAGEVAKEQEAKDKREHEKAKKGRPEKHKTGKFANFSMQKSDESEKYYLYADIKYPSGDIERHKPIAEFPDKKQAEEFCKSRGITCDDVTDNLENVIRHKKHMANDKGTQPPSRENGRKRSDIGDE